MKIRGNTVSTTIAPEKVRAVTIIESFDTDNPVILRDLESGIYQLSGRFRAASGIDEHVSISEKRLALIKKAGTYTAVRFFNVTGTDTIYKIEDSAWTQFDIPNLKMLTEDKIVTALDETADDKHIPSAKAVYDALNGADPIDYSVYFDIDVDGLISLKPEYRGDAQYTAYPYSISDNGLGVEGSKINELPERIVIPNNIDGEEVTRFQSGMFCNNKRIKEITIPSTVKALSGGFAREAIHLEKVINTEQLENISSGAFQQTRIREMICPQLTTIGKNVFKNAVCLQRVDLGKISSIPNSTFEYCEDLVDVRADNVTSIGDASFYATRRLKSLPFLANVKSIGYSAFWSSRCDLETLPADCKFGDLACYKQFNTDNYWTGVSFTPCKNPLGSLFDQKDPRWADKEIKYTDKAGKVWAYVDENGEPCTYGSNGCALLTLVSIYSAFMKVQFDTPEDFLPVLEEAGALGINFRERITWCQIANKLGFETDYIDIMTAANLQKVYDALADGALLYKSTVGSYANGTADGGHALLGYGINSDGEMLTSDTSMRSYLVEIYENHKNAWHIYKHGSKECDCVIVRKKSV